MEKLITDTQFAEYLGMNVRTLRRKIQANKMAIAYIPALGRQMRFRPDEIERYIQSLEVTKDGSGVVASVLEHRDRGWGLPNAMEIMSDEEARSFFHGMEVHGRRA
jgi:excisionase family DNA binding protein